MVRPSSAALTLTVCCLAPITVAAFVPQQALGPSFSAHQSRTPRGDVTLLSSSSAHQSRTPRGDVTLLSSSEDDASDLSEETIDSAGSFRTVFTRRSLLSASSSTTAAAALLSAVALSTANPDAALAGIDPNALKSLRVEGDASGATTRLQQIEAAKGGGADVMVDKPWEDLPSGVQFREYREGRGDTVVQPGSKVAVEMTIRCKSFSTANEPGGVKYFSTKEDTDFNELAFTVGSGEMLPGLEEGMMGMRKGGLRRVEVPSTMVFAARKEGQLPLPSEKNKDGKRRFENLFKTDATLLFEVLVTRVK